MNFILTESITEQDILDAVEIMSNTNEPKIGYTNYDNIYSAYALFITPNGSVISVDDFDVHSIFMNRLFADYFEETVDTLGQEPYDYVIQKLGFITLNNGDGFSDTRCKIVIEKQPTQKQYNILEDWLERIFREGKDTIIIYVNGETKTYNLRDLAPRDLIKRIQKKFVSGILESNQIKSITNKNPTNSDNTNEGTSGLSSKQSSANQKLKRNIIKIAKQNGYDYFVNIKQLTVHHIDDLKGEDELKNNSFDNIYFICSDDYRDRETIHKILHFMDRNNIDYDSLLDRLEEIKIYKYNQLDNSFTQKTLKSFREALEESISKNNRKEHLIQERMYKNKSKIRKDLKDLTGQKFGELTVLEYDKDKSRESGQTYWKCKCSCGKETSVARKHLIDGSIKSCGHTKRQNGLDHIDNFDGMRDRQNKYNTNLEVIRNQKMQPNNTSGVKGVDYHKSRDEWRARVHVGGREITKWFKNKEDAIKWRKEAEDTYYKPKIDQAIKAGDLKESKDTFTFDVGDTAYLLVGSFYHHIYSLFIPVTIIEKGTDNDSQHIYTYKDLRNNNKGTCLESQLYNKEELDIKLAKGSKLIEIDEPIEKSIQKANKELKNRYNLKESFEKLSDTGFITDNPYDIKNLILNKPKLYRIIYDANIDKYMIGDGDQVLHDWLIDNAIEDLYYHKIDTKLDTEENISNYIQIGQGSMSSEIKPYLYYLVSIPRNSNEKETLKNELADGYEKAYIYDDFIIMTRDCNFKELELYSILGMPNRIRNYNQIRQYLNETFDNNSLQERMKVDSMRLSQEQDRRRKLSDEQKEEIRKLYATGEYSLNSLAREYGVSKKTILLIVNPDSKAKSDARIRDHWQDYYDKEEHNKAIKNLRDYKKDLLKKGELK